MNSKLDPQAFRTQQVPLKPLIARIASGTALLFVGSGFSRNGVNFSNGVFPNAKELAESVGKLGGFDSEGDLKYASEKFLRDNDPQRLVNHLLELFAVSEVLDHQVAICGAPWRRVYTTNYDLCVEEASRKAGRHVEAVDTDDTPGAFLTHRNVCVHLNGSLNNLRVETLNSSFKLSESSYLSAESFTTSAWNSPFRRDLEMSSAIVFVGYSLYDIEIQKILFANHEFAKKTYFITSPTTSARERFTLEPFGECAPIGAEAFGQALADELPQMMAVSEAGLTTSILPYKLNETVESPRDADVDRFLMYGDVKDAVLETALFSDGGAPLVVKREALDEALDALSANKHVAVVAAFGNGKSVFLRIVKAVLAQRGERVYTVEHPDIYNREDLETLAKQPQRKLLFVDSYEQHVELLEHFHDLQPTNITLVLAARTTNHEHHRNHLTSLGIACHEIGIDQMSIGEVERFVEILDNAAFWGDRGALSNEAKINFLQHKHSSEIASGLLTILQAPQMVSRVAEILKALFVNNSVRDTVFAICVLSTLDLPLTSSNISDVAKNDEIYSSSLRSDVNFQLMFKTNGSVVTTRSSLFALALVRNNFPPTFIVDQLLNIASAIGGEQRAGSYENELLKSLLRFSVVERFLPEKQRINNLVRYYENLKRRIYWLKDDPHYWLQYAMAQLAYEDFEKAQRYLDQAFLMAAKRREYHTVHLDMQQARLYMKTSSLATSGAESIKLLGKAVVHFNKVPGDIQKFRQVERIVDVYASSFKLYNSGQQATFAKIYRQLLKELDQFVAAEPVAYKGGRTLEAIQSNLRNLQPQLQS